MRVLILSILILTCWGCGKTPARVNPAAKPKAAKPMPLVEKTPRQIENETLRPMEVKREQVLGAFIAFDDDEALEFTLLPGSSSQYTSKPTQIFLQIDENAKGQLVRASLYSMFFHPDNMKEPEKELERFNRFSFAFAQLLMMVDLDIDGAEARRWIKELMLFPDSRSHLLDRHGYKLTMDHVAGFTTLAVQRDPDFSGEDEEVPE